jgi:hypothetical protein
MAEKPSLREVADIPRKALAVGMRSRVRAVHRVDHAAELRHEEGVPDACRVREVQRHAGGTRARSRSRSLAIDDSHFQSVDTA